MGFELSVARDGYEKLDRVIDRLGEVYRSIPRDTHEAILEEAQLLKNKAAVKAANEPTFGPKHTGLRGKVAAGVGVEETDDGARITTSMPKRDEAIIPRGFDRGFGGWRHPLFGDKARWFRQNGKYSWFMSTMRDGDKDLKRKIGEVLKEAAYQVRNA